ncbi:hypothetical protein Tco_1472627, partial [Tanacetum coccineum]
TYPNLLIIKIYHNGVFSKPSERRYTFALLDYVDSVDSDMFSLYELFEMLKELELHLGESLVVSQSHSKRVGNVIVIEEIVEDNVVSVVEKTQDLVEPTNDENVRYLYCDNDVPMGNPFSFINLLEGSNIDIHNVANEHDIVDGVPESAFGDIHEKLQHASNIHKKVQETLMDDDLFQQDSVVDY